MRHLVRQVICEDSSGRRYRVEVFVNTCQMQTAYGVWDVDDPPECWIDTGRSYWPVNVVEPFDVFTFVDGGQIMTLHRTSKAAGEG